MVKHVDYYYPVRVWLLSITAGPMIFPLIMLYEKNYGSGEAGPLTVYGLLLFIGFLYSIPSLVISFLVYRYLLLQRMGITPIKVALIILGFVIFTATFYVMGYPLHKLENLEKWTLPISYSIFFILGSIIFKIEKDIEVTT